MEISDKTVIVEIYNSKGRTRYLASRYGVSAGVIAQIKGGTGVYREVIKDYKIKMAQFLWRRQYGYDAVSRITPPPFGSQNQTKQSPEMFKTRPKFKKSA